MKKTLVLFALVDLSAAVVVLSAVHGQTKTRNLDSGARARRNAFPINTSSYSTVERLTFLRFFIVQSVARPDTPSASFD